MGPKASALMEIKVNREIAPRLNVFFYQVCIFAIFVIIERISFNRHHSADPLEAESELSKETVASVCGCGRKAKSRSQRFCVPDTKETKSRFPCVLNKGQCETKCRCLNCENRVKNNDKISCRYGESDKNSELQRAVRKFCTDVDGQRRTKCRAIRMGKLVPVSVHAGIEKMFMAKEKRTVCQDLPPTEDER